jgi:NAD(P)-dependent dehydrogenase (short-subunit alcohol dehydrogenase family)
LVTGGDSGIGRAVAAIFAREGADIALAYLPDEESDAAETRDFIERQGRKCMLLPGNLTSPQYCADIVARTVAELGKIDILVSNAAHQNRKESLADLSDDELVETFATNLLAYVRLARAALEVMSRGSVIIATSSETGIRGSRKLPDYSATKGA